MRRGAFFDLLKKISITFSVIGVVLLCYKTVNMISIREIDYGTNENPDLVFSRLTWAVEQVDGLAGELINGVTADTNRPWVGVYNKKEMNFELIEPSGYFLNKKIFQVVIKGQIIDDGSKTKINIKLGLGWHTLFTYGLIYTGTLFMIIMTTFYGEIRDIWSLFVWILVFPVLGTILLKRKLDKVESRVEDLFGVR